MPPPVLSCKECGQPLERYWDDEGDLDHPDEMPPGWWYRCAFCETRFPEGDTPAALMRNAGVPSLFDDLG